MAWPCMALPPDSCDHRQIEYALQLAIGKHAEVRRISAIDNPLARHQFGRRTSGVLKLHSFVAEDDGAAVEDGRLRWAAPREGTSGMSVHIGAVPPGVLADPTDADSGRRTLVYCLAAVGQAWPVDAATLARCQTERGIQPPTGYDSFVLGETIAAPEDGSGADGGSWRHRWIERRSDDPAAATAAATAAAASRPASYWLADRSQVLPMYVVEFDVPPPPAAAAAAPSATVACDDPGHCQYHNCPCEYYCPRCQTAMCAECKLTGHHSHGPALRHVLQPLPVAYRAAVENCQDGANPMLLTAVANLDAARESVRARAAAVQDNAADVRRGLAAMVSAINAQIDHAENCRLAALQSQEIELARQLRTLRAGEDFLRSQTDNLPMAAFMQTWATHVHSRTPMLSEGAPDLLLAGGVGGGSGEATGVMGYEAHSHGTPVHGPDTSAGALSMSSGGSSLVSFDSPSQMSLQGSNSVAATPHGATPGAGLAVPGSCSSAVAEALMDVSPLPNLTLHGAIGLRVANGVQQEHQQAGQTHPPSNEAAEPWWEPPKTVSAATRAASAARSASTVTANRQFLVAGGESAHGGVQWGWCSQPDDGQSRAKERAARLRSAFRNAAMAGGGAAAALMGGEGGGRAKSATLSRSAEVIVAQAVTLASGKVNALQSIEVTPCSCESGNNRSEPAVRVEIRHADAASGGLGIGFGRYNLPYRFPAACTTNACAVQISSVVPGSVASLRPDLRVGSVIVAVNGHRVNTMRLEDVMKELEAAEAAAALEMDGELDEASLVLELLHEHSAPAMPPLSPRERGWNEDGAEEQLVEAAQPAPPRPPPPFADRVADQLDDVLSEVILEEQTAAAVRIQAVYRGGVQRLDNQISHLAATMVQAAMRGARARKAIAVHRAALLAEEERTRQAELAAMPPLQEAVEEQEVEEEPVDMSFKQQHVRETPPSGRAATSVSAAKHDGSQPWDDAEVPVGLLGAKLRTLESAAAANAEDSDGSMIATPRTLARQLEVSVSRQTATKFLAHLRLHTHRLWSPLSPLRVTEHCASVAPAGG
jgi:hypothetical protein